MGIDPAELARQSYRAPTKFTGWGSYGGSLGTGTVQITGLKELHIALQNFPAKFEANVVRGGLRAGIVEIKKIAESKLSGQTRLKQSLKISTRNRKGKVTAELKVGGGNAWFAKFVEFGTATKYTGTGKTVGKKYLIKPKKKGVKLLRLHDGSFRVSVMHPGAKSQPYMRPAFDQGSGAAIRAFASYARRRISQASGNK